jgi:hypothetical protein
MNSIGRACSMEDGHAVRFAFLRGLAQKVRIGPTARRNTELAHDAMPSVRASRAQARDHCACAREDPK